MRLRPVESEMLVAAGYDDKSCMLQVVFTTGETYRYKEVPFDQFEALMSAESKGRFMQKHIIGHYEYERV